MIPISKLDAATRTYIRMCDCEEVRALCQNYWDWDSLLVTRCVEGADYLSNRLCSQDGLAYYDDENQERVSASSYYVLRQDDIQRELLTKGHSDLITLLDNFRNWARMPTKDFICESFEQAWLCYYMETVHHKRWNGEKWEVEDGKT